MCQLLSRADLCDPKHCSPPGTDSLLPESSGKPSPFVGDMKKKIREYLILSGASWLPVAHTWAAGWRKNVEECSPERMWPFYCPSLWGMLLLTSFRKHRDSPEPATLSKLGLCPWGAPPPSPFWLAWWVWEEGSEPDFVLKKPSQFLFCFPTLMILFPLDFCSLKVDCFLKLRLWKAISRGQGKFCFRCGAGYVRVHWIMTWNCTLTVCALFRMSISPEGQNEEFVIYYERSSNSSVTKEEQNEGRWYKKRRIDFDWCENGESEVKVGSDPRMSGVCPQDVCNFLVVFVITGSGRLETMKYQVMVK